MEEVAAINAILSPHQLFTRLANIHLRMPVEQTYKSYCDCASELYKVVGPDALSQSTIKILLQERFGLTAESLIHKDSQRPLSSLQLLGLLESKLAMTDAFTGPLKVVAKLRIDADHKILSPDSEIRSYSKSFADLCNDLTKGISVIREALASKSNAT